MSDPIRFSNLKRMAQSPAHYRAGLTARYDSPAMRLGRLVHAIALGTELPAVYDGERRGKAWAEFEEEHAGREIVTRAEWERGEPIAHAVLHDEVACSYLLRPGVVRERRIDWTYQGRAVQSTPDAVDLDTGLIVDLKTSQTSAPTRFSRLAIAAHYHAQLAFYRWAVAAVHGVDTREHILIAVETSAPYAVTCHRLTPRAIEEGEKLCRAWLERLFVCESSDVWPGYVQCALDLDVEPGFALSIDGEDIET